MFCSMAFPIVAKSDVSAEWKQLIVLAIGEELVRRRCTLPSLLQLMDCSAPDARVFTHIGVVACYLQSRRAIMAVEDVVRRAESLRDTDAAALHCAMHLISVLARMLQLAATSASQSRG
jgi:hypothetical protein